MSAFRFIFLAALAWLVIGLPARATELIMVERKGCHYCIEWKTQLGPIYPKTSEGAFAPLRIVDITDGTPDDVVFESRVVFTPTFILVEGGRELARIEGYPGEDFFWGLLDIMLTRNTDYKQEPKTN
jgi:thioredoxin-related protein